MATTTTAATAAVHPLSAAAAAAAAATGVSTIDEENTSSSSSPSSPPPPWWQFHRRLSLPSSGVAVTVTVGAHDNNRRTEFDTIDWGSGNDNESGTPYDDDDDDSLPLFDKEPPPPPPSQKRELLIDFGPRRNNLAVRKLSSIVTNNDDDDETVNMEASTPATMGDDSVGHRQLSPEGGSLQEELRNCEDSSKYIYLVNNEDGGNCSNENSNGMTTLGRDDNNNSDDDDGGTDNKGCRRKTPQPSPRTIREESDLDKSTSFHGFGLDDSNYDDECLINYSFDENGDDAKHNNDQGKNQGNIVKTDTELTTTRPPFHASKSMEIHDSIWDLRSSGLDYEHEQMTGVRDDLKVDNHMGSETSEVDTANSADINVFVPTPSLLSKLENFDDVSSIASSIHSGRILRKEKRYNRLSFVKTPPFGFLGGQRTHLPPSAGGHASEDVSVTHEHDAVITEDDVFDDTHSRGECTTMSNQSWRKRQKQPKRRQSFVASLKSTMAWSANHKTMDQSSSDTLCDDVDECDWDDNDDRYLEEEFFATKDATNEAIVKDACEIMTTVNKSAVAMGMEPPFLPVVETFPPCKKLHSIIGYQMQVLKAAIGNPQGMMKRKSHRQSKAAHVPITSSSICSDPQMMGDRRRLSTYIKNQMAMMDPFSQSRELLDSSANSSSCNPYLVHMYTSYLPNYMWYQPVASDSTTTMRPTSLCSGTGITGKSQYLQPDMLHMFRMFGSYLVGSGHLFLDDDDDDDVQIGKKVKNKHNIHVRRSAFWPDIPENEDENEDESISSNVESMASNPSSSSSGNDFDYQDSRLMQQHELIEQIIEDLRRGQMSS